MLVARQQQHLTASSVGDTKSSNCRAAHLQLDKCLFSQQRHALLPSDAARTNM